MAGTVQTAINVTAGLSVQVLPADPLRKYMAIQIYTTSPNPCFVAFGQVATAGNNGEWQMTIGAVMIFGTTPPSVISTNTTYASPAPPLGSVNIIGQSGNAVGSILTISG